MRWLSIPDPTALRRPTLKVHLSYRDAGVGFEGPVSVLGDLGFLYSDFVTSHDRAEPDYRIYGTNGCAEIRQGDRLVHRAAGEGDLLFSLDWLAACHLLGELESSWVPLHAAGLQMPGGGTLLMPGPSGVGKSYLARALVEQGCTFLSDEYVPIDSRSLEPAAYPRSLGLKCAAVDSTGDFDAVLSRAADSSWLRPIRRLPPGRRAAPVRRIVLPRYRRGAESRLEPLVPFRVVPRLLAEAPFLEDDRPRTFETMAELATRVPAFELTYGDAGRAAARILES